MQNLWNWLMRANAKGLFLACLLTLLVMLGWRGSVEVLAARAAHADLEALHDPPPPPDAPPYEGYGILEYVGAQTRPDAQALPVDLFRPTLDAMVSNLVAAILSDPDIDTSAPVPEPRTRPTLAPGEEDLFQVVQRPDGRWVRRPRPTPPPVLAYHGVFRRSDGHTAAWVTETTSRTARFYQEGDEAFGATVLGVSTDSLTVRLPDGTEEVLPRGGRLTLPAPVPEARAEAEVEEAAPAADRPAAAARGRRRDGGVRRIPTEAELRALDRTNPELAARLRAAIRERQERDAQQGVVR